MIELKKNRLCISFPDVHPSARMNIEFQRTLRIPDDDRTYPLPPGLGAFPLRHVDDYAERVSESWRQHGGVMLPIYQSEAMWLNFDSPDDYPFAVKVAAGKVNAVTGDEWAQGLSKSPQNYLPIPEQPWLDGFCVEKGTIRQFVAMPLGAGYSAEEQITGEANHGGLQIEVFPLKAKRYRALRTREASGGDDQPLFCGLARSPDMGLSPGGRMEQEIYEDDHPLSHYESDHRSRCFVHLSNSMVWREITGQDPPTVPPTAKEYERAGLPWFDYYSETPAVDGATKLAGMKSVAALGKEKNDANDLPRDRRSSEERFYRAFRALCRPPMHKIATVDEGELWGYNGACMEIVAYLGHDFLIVKYDVDGCERRSNSGTGVGIKPVRFWLV